MIRNALLAWAEKEGRGYPDWAMRYVPALKLLQPWLKPDASVLELGANANGMARFTSHAVIAVDISRGNLREYVKRPNVSAVCADMRALPFADAAVPACVCMDTFEHLAAADRAQAVAEMARVLQRGGAAVAGFPSGAHAAAAEQRIRDAYRRATGRTIVWLEEHVEHGLPDAEQVARDFETQGLRVAHQSNTPVRVWEAMWQILMCGWPGRGNVVFQVLLRAATPLLVRLKGAPAYRALLLARK